MYNQISELFCLALLCAFVIPAQARREGTEEGVRIAPTSRWVKVATENFDPQTLAERLRNTKAIGFFTKLQLRGDIESLVKELAELHHGKGQATRAQLHERFQLLFHKIVSLLQDKDPQLAKNITNARQSLWDWVSDPNKSVKL